MRTVTRVFILLSSLSAAPIAVAAGCGGDAQQTSSSASTTSTESSGGGRTTSGSGGNTSTSGTGGAAMTSSGATTSAGGGSSSTGGAGTGGATSTTGAGGAMTSSTGGGTPGTGGADAGSDAPVIISVVKCLNQIYLCGDGVDNDGDGLIDWQDPDCLGPCDNTEDSYYGGIPGQSGPACDVDCYWDSNSGSGDDDCKWNHKCDPSEQVSPGHPEPIAKCAYNLDANISGTNQSCTQLDQQQSATCLSFCGPLTPNGCDCFGCCELPAGSGKYVWLGSEDEQTNTGSCTAAGLGDPTKCEPCQPVQGCLNACAKCELCIGKTTLPPECFVDGGVVDGGDAGPDGGAMQCAEGLQPCGLPGQALCPQDYYCITGCCIAHM